MSTEISLIQKPVIQHKLVEVGLRVTSRIEELNIANLVATDETIKSLKNLRADLNKELGDYEAQRKALKEAVATPYQEFETVYKTEISEKYKVAIDTLKDKIGEFEDRVKKEKQENIERYFNELCTASKIDFLIFGNAGIEINLSTSEKQYKEKCDQFVNRVADDIILIDSMDFAAEMMAEYKKNGFNASGAIQTVKSRKEAEELEQKRIKLIETQRREGMLRKLSMVFHDITRTFNWVNDESVCISQSDIEKLPKEEFQKWYVEIEATIKSKTDLFSQQAPKTEQSSPVCATPVTEPIPQPAEALQAPVEEKKEEIFKATFECEGTFSQLKALGQYMKDNGITYKNI